MAIKIDHHAALERIYAARRDARSRASNRRLLALADAPIISDRSTLLLLQSQLQTNMTPTMLLLLLLLMMIDSC